MLGFLARRNVDPREELRRVLGDYTLPTFSGTVLAVLQEIRREGASAASVATAIEHDPRLSVDLLRVANSAAYGSARPTERLSQAVAVLGLSKVEMLVLALGVKAVLPSSDAPGFEGQAFWQTSAVRATAARAFAAELHPASSSQSFTASLLQDMAVPLLAHARKGSYGTLLEEWRHGGPSLERLEQETLGCDHGEIASWLCDLWSLPETLAEAVAGHHGAEDLTCPPAVRIVAWLREGEEGGGVDEAVELAWTEFGVLPDRSMELLQSSARQAETLSALLS